MSYEPKCIRDVINDLNKSIYLPAIQREFVWDTYAVEKLFDSIMGDYPISSFLFWKIKEENKKDWTSYEFIRDFDEDSPHNKEADLSGVNKDVYLVLDGQQRLTSLYIGLKGTFSYFYYRQYKTKLYLNLLKAPLKNDENPEELTYQFEFRESADTENSETEYWYLIGKILDFDDSEDAKESIKGELNHYSDVQKTNANKLIGNLHSRIHTHRLINYYEEKSQHYDKVVEVFIRANTGGKKLDFSDILLSTATAKWKTMNAREEIQSFTDKLNNIGTGYSFSKDITLKGCLYLTDDLPIQYKIKNFTPANLERMEANWVNIVESLETSVRLISKFGFTDKNVPAAGAILPISFYLMKLGKKNYQDSSSKKDVENQNLIQQWLILSLLKNSFGGSSDTTLKNIRDELFKQTSFEEFPIEAINKILNIEPSFNDTETEKLLNSPYKSKYSYLILSLLYPNRDWKDNVYHEDHIYPQSEFTTAKLKKRGYDDVKIANYQMYFNSIGNLQLLTNSENLQKNASDFDSWIATRDANFKMRHNIPELNSYSFDNFLDFVSNRRNLVTAKLKQIQSVKKGVAANN